MENVDKKHPRCSQNRRLQQAKLQRKVRKSQRRLVQLRVLWKFFIIVFLITLCLYLLKMPQWRLNSSAFDSLNSPALEIVNNRIVPANKVLAALRRNTVSTRPIFLLKTDNLKKSIMQLEPVLNVYIRRYWFPARLQINIVERTPAITISPDIDVEPIAFFSTDGKLIGREYMPLSSDFKTVKVITYGSGDDYRNWDQSMVNNLRRLANTVEMDSGENVEYIDYRNPKDVYVKIPTVSIRLGTFSPASIDKIHRIPSLLPQVKVLNKNVQYIDLRWDTNFIKLGD